MSEKKGDKEGCPALELIDFKNALEQFQNLVEKMIIQKTKESSDLYTKDDDERDYGKFYTTTRTLFGSAVKDQDIQAFFRKVMSNLDVRPEWLEIFGCFRRANGGVSSASKESMVLLVSEKQQITHSGDILHLTSKTIFFLVLCAALFLESRMKSNILSLTVVKRKDVIKGIVKVPLLHLTVTASQKGVLTVFRKQMKVLTTINIERKSFFSYLFYFHQDTAWITGCDFLPNLNYVVAVTESTIILWDYKSKESKSDGFVIKPMKNCLLCVCTVTVADNLAKDTILMGDDKGYVYLLTITSDDFIMKQSKAEKEAQFKVLDSESFDIPKRKLHDDWVGKIKYFSDLKRFGSCSTDSTNSFVLDDIKRLEDHLPVKEFSVPKGVNAFTYCGKAKVIVTGGNLLVFCFLLSATEGYIFRWNMASFLEDSRNKKNEIKEELCWRAHAAEVVDLFIEEEKNVVVTASIDSSVRVWHARIGYYFGYFGQARKFELTDTSRLILPSDVNDFSAIIKEESKHTEKKEVLYPLVLDRDK
ncbi:WD repeat-containing protein 64 [Lonchura striata]|uniref:WD repeat-containing protein 64 n=1 Tax=Lonchura striata TaxID=40157 RepID=A0A218VBN1_9PASE|nr:WD repeat-containing protein 64 [Lonchura striata domestica]